MGWAVYARIHNLLPALPPLPATVGATSSARERGGMSCYDEEAPIRAAYLRLMESEKEARAKHHELCVQVKKMMRALDRYWRLMGDALTWDDVKDMQRFPTSDEDLWSVFEKRRERVERIIQED